MQPEEITETLSELFGEMVSQPDETAWQVEASAFRLLVLLSEDRSWMRILLPIAPINAAQNIFDKLLEANFDLTQETRYAIHQDIIWGVFQGSRENFNPADFRAAIATLLALQERGLSEFYNQRIEDQIRQIIRMAKRQGQSMEATLQNLNRLYSEGLMGEMEAGAENRERTLAAWRYQLERLWPEVE